MPLEIRDRSSHRIECFAVLFESSLFESPTSAEARRNKGRSKFNTIQYLLSTEAFYLSKYESILFDVSDSIDIVRYWT